MDNAIRVATIILQLGLCSLILSIWIVGRPPMSVGDGASKRARAE